QVLYYPPEQYTASSREFRIAEIIREKILINCEKEIPHLTAVQVEKYDEREKKLIIDAVIVCSKESHKGIIIGRGGQMLQKINQQASKDISEMVGKRVYLSLFVKVEEDWLNKSNKLFDLGYLQKNNED
ncbi:MAG: KH domain-containing protein, partial [Erysipelotrichaceae bacterium]|nr:KH domain-containing protein [Erysipelotrichaceae bacterium]